MLAKQGSGPPKLLFPKWLASTGRQVPSHPSKFTYLRVCCSMSACRGPEWQVGRHPISKCFFWTEICLGCGVELRPAALCLQSIAACVPEMWVPSAILSRLYRIIAQGTQVSSTHAAGMLCLQASCLGHSYLAFTQMTGQHASSPSLQEPDLWCCCCSSQT